MVEMVCKDIFYSKSMRKTGRPTELNDKLKAKIRIAIFESEERPTMANIGKKTKINYSTIKDWVYRNYKGFDEFWRGCLRDRMLMLAESVSEDVLCAASTNEKGEIDKELLRIKQKEAEFIRETLGKESYSKRNEHTGKDGEPLGVVVLPQRNGNSLGADNKTSGGVKTD